MDEVLFRSSQKLENFQVQLNLAISHSKDFFHQYSETGKLAILQAWNSTYSEQFKHQIKEIWVYIVNVSGRLKEQLWIHLDPQQLYYNLVKVFWKKWTKRDVCFLSAGFICGGLVGAMFTLSLKRKGSVVRYMQAVQCTNYLGIESATLVENAIAPDKCGENDVIINVKAASVNVIDAQICHGYGRVWRKILRKSDLPVILGRDCTGIITDIGANVKRLEVGDEVWMTLPFWAEGTICQSVKAAEFRIGRKPKNIGFEGACSLPYAGSLALKALKDMELTLDNAKDKRILVIEGCSPVGCVLIQILNYWKANVTATCTKRALPVAKALGACDILVSPEHEESQDSMHAFVKELELRHKFDFVVITKEESALQSQDFDMFCSGKVVSTVAPTRSSDNAGFIGGLLFNCLIRINYLLEKILGLSLIDYDEAHMCYVTLDELADLVEIGCLQTVVDKVYYPQDIEIALNHIQSQEAIGSTVITFR